MDELSEEDKLTVARARKIQRFLSQPFQVAEVFTGHMGKLVPLKETIKGFKDILDGKCVRCSIHLLQTCTPQQVLTFVSLQACTTVCPSRPSTWLAPSRRWF